MKKKNLTQIILCFSLLTTPLLLCAEEQSEDSATIEETIHTQFEHELLAQQYKINQLEEQAIVLRDELVDSTNELEQLKKDLDQAIKKYEYYQKQLEKSKSELLKSEKNNKQLNKALHYAHQKLVLGVSTSAIIGFIAGCFMPSRHN